MNTYTDVYRIYTKLPEKGKEDLRREQEEQLKNEIKKEGFAIFSSITDHLFYTTCPPNKIKKLDKEGILASWAEMEEK